jgi:hypothetical protein
MTEAQQMTLDLLETEAHEHEAKAAAHIRKAGELEAKGLTTTAAYERKSARVHTDIARITRDDIRQLELLIAEDHRNA